MSLTLYEPPPDDSTSGAAVVAITLLTIAFSAGVVVGVVGALIF